MKDHEIAMFVNNLRDVAVKYHEAQQLRDRISHLVQDFLSSHTKEAAPSEEAKLLQEARIALGMMLSYHGPGNAEYTDAAQFTAQEAFDNIDKFQSATQAPEETKDKRRSNEDRETL